MASSERMTLCNPKTNKYDAVGGPAFGVWHWQEIALSLSYRREVNGKRLKVPPLAYYYALHFHSAGTEPCQGTSALVNLVTDLVIKKYEGRDLLPGQYRRLAMVIIHKSMQEHRCTNCKGQGVTRGKYPGAKSTACRKCGGKGVNRLKHSECYEAACIQKDTYHRHCKALVDEICQLLDRQLDVVAVHLSRVSG